MDGTECCCSIMVNINDNEKQIQLEQQFRSFLHNIKLPFEIIQFVTDTDESAYGSSIFLDNNNPSSGSPQPDTLAVCLFLNETSGDMPAEYLKKQLQASPWQLSHVYETSHTDRPEKIARQEFYRLSENFPLWSINTVHYGNEHVRFHINAKHFLAMKEFYETLTDCKATDCGPRFSFLTIYSETGLDIQIGLKHCPNMSYSMKPYRLRFTVLDGSPIFKYLQQFGKSSPETNYILEDPDGNPVIVECQSRAQDSLVREEALDKFSYTNDETGSEVNGHKKTGFVCNTFNEISKWTSSDNEISQEKCAMLHGEGIFKDCKDVGFQCLVCERNNNCNCDDQEIDYQESNDDCVTYV